MGRNVVGDEVYILILPVQRDVLLPAVDLSADLLMVDRHPVRQVYTLVA